MSLVISQLSCFTSIHRPNNFQTRLCLRPKVLAVKNQGARNIAIPCSESKGSVSYNPVVSNNGTSENVYSDEELVNEIFSSGPWIEISNVMDAFFSIAKNQGMVIPEILKTYDGIDRYADCSYVEKKTNDFLQFSFDMPGLCIDDVTISVDEGSFFDGFNLKIVGEGKESEFDGKPRTYTAEFDFPQMDYDCDVPEYEKEMKNGLLRVTIPKVKICELPTNWRLFLRNSS